VSVPAAERVAPLDFAVVYEARFADVCRWARACGGAEGDLEDLAQEVFVVVRRKLAAFDGRDLAAWLYRITARTVSDYRRRAWFKHLFQRPRSVELDRFAQPGLDPAASLERREAERLVFRLLSAMSEKRRTVLALIEIEGCSSEEVAALQGVPVATVRTRLHHARKEFTARLSRHRAREAK
jgi:RNA polymerase sigma-70 factor (ECF subfamily)